MTDTADTVEQLLRRGVAYKVPLRGGFHLSSSMSLFDSIPLIVAGAIGLVVCAQGAIWFVTWRRGWKLREEEFSLRRSLLMEELSIAQLKRQGIETQKLGWKGYRKFVVHAKVPESDDVMSLFLVPQDDRPLPTYEPGQFVGFRCRLSDGRAVSRCYSLSDRPRPEFYRISVKRVPATDSSPAGTVSNWVHDGISPGDIVELQAPSGHFVFDPFERRPAILIGAGIGITPIFAMAAHAAQVRTPRQIVMFHGCRGSRDHVFKRAVGDLRRAHSSLQVVTCYSRPDAKDRLGHDYDVQGRVSVQLLKELLPSNNFDFYLCGPGSLMEELVPALRAWGVPDASIHYEAFGPSSLGGGKSSSSAPAGNETAPTTGTKIKFSMSGIEAGGSANQTLLETAEAAGVEIANSCRNGNCGTCISRLTSGSVRYDSPPGYPCEAGECLPCVAKPSGDVELDA